MLKLMVLGLLMEKNRHPYEIRQTIKLRHWDQVFRLRDGSLYYAVDQLREEGQIEAAEVIATPGNNRPDKIVYRITDRGREAFLELLYAQLKQPAYPQHPMFLALPFVRHADPERVAEIAAAHREVCAARIARIEGVLAEKSSNLPRGSVFLMKGIIAQSKAEGEWLGELIQEAESGKLVKPEECAAE